MTVVETPPQRQPCQDEREALIEEARRRTRRRRLIIGGTLLAAAVIGGAIWAAIAFTGGDSTTSNLPEGFSSVQARGPVQHVELETMPSRITDIDLATGRRRPARLTYEVWYDPRTKHYRVVDRVDGSMRFDVVGAAGCSRIGSGETVCLPPGPFALLSRFPSWPLDPRHFRAEGAGTSGGRRVIWIAPVVDGRVVRRNRLARWGLDTGTHRPVVVESEVGRFLQRDVFEVMSDVSPQKVAFAVPEGGVPSTNAFPPAPDESLSAKRAGLADIRHALERTPLWLGRGFRGHRLGRVEAGTDAIRARTGRRLLPVKFVRLDYGTLRLTEYGADRPWWFRSGPAAGRILLENDSRAALVRNGLLVVMEWGGDKRFPLDAASALATARALRPLPGG